MDSDLTKSCLRILFIALAVVLFLFILHYVLELPMSNSWSQSSHFTVILDCGSTGTRVTVYEWLRNSTNDQELPALLRSLPDELHNSTLRKKACQYHCMQTVPGLHKLVHNLSGLHSALEPLLLWAQNQIPHLKHKETPVFILATAGLRQLAIADADWILKNIHPILKGHPFSYQNNSIRVLTGQEESYYGWVALNYRMHKLGRFAEGPSLGILDLGGSSLQIVMEVGQPIKTAHVFTSKIDFVGHRLLLSSLSALGLNVAFDRSIVMLSNGKFDRTNMNGRTELRHPCLNSGFQQNYTCNGCSTVPNMTHWKDASIKYQNNQPTTFVLVGNPDWMLCRKLVRAVATLAYSSDQLHLLYNTTCKDHSSSVSVGNELRNQTTKSGMITHFHALSGFFAMSHMLKLEARANMTQLLVRGQHICSKSWDDLKSIYGDQYYVEQLCFRAPYLAVLLEEVLCLDTADITFGPGDVSWTLGAALIEDRYLWSSKTASLAGNFDLKNMFVSSIAILFPLAVCLVIGLVYRKKRFFQSWMIPNVRKRESSVVVSLPISIPPKDR